MLFRHIKYNKNVPLTEKKTEMFKNILNTQENKRVEFYSFFLKHNPLN